MQTPALPFAETLVYGFGPFRHYRSNITEKLVNSLPADPRWQAHWQTCVLPVRFEPELFLAAITPHTKRILGLGQCPRGSQIRIERRGFNLMRDRQAAPPLEQPIDPAGPARRYASWKIQPTGCSRLSYDAGRYVCNYQLYLLSAYAAEHQLEYAFLHIPRGFSLPKARAFVLQLLATEPKTAQA